MSKKRKRAPDSSGTSTTTVAVNTGDSTTSQSASTAPAGNSGSANNISPVTQAKPEVSSAHISSQKATSTTRALQAPKWLYLYLQPIVPHSLTASNGTFSSAKQDFKLDETTLRLQLLSALSAYLGDTGAAIPVDILKVSVSGHEETQVDTDITLQQTTESTSSASTRNKRRAPPEAYLRVPYGDGALFCAAITSWAGINGTGISAVGGYRILEKSCWLSCLNLHDHGQEDDLFDFGAG